ncbi:hypothetical protein [Methylobacterium persicinum]|uniref:Uncharacterized protein n=1 Tax=Methylobacterium persicinum TaxID=374426 RepID=A0ABU0HJJ3_9HYPH|nr:hypothetical protein [Methylobacterium persicinum]MDQ0442489.1 hypothetical protein [Methylobacterium persicinum]GJE40521.1 hypothetical protein KHHGKMAE_4616 [Methylobacterium persicinum]
MRHLVPLAAALLLCGPAQAEMRNAPSPRAMQFAAYIFAASNVCGYRIGVPEFEALLTKQNSRIADVQPGGPFGNQVQTMFTIMSNQMQMNREGACIAVAGEYGPDGNIARNVLQPGGAEPPAPAPDKGKPPEAAKPAQ